MIFRPLASSSHGNAYLLDDGHTVLLIECGVTYKKLQKLMGFSVSRVDACLISHEHKDHAGCYDQLHKNGTPVFTSAGTAEALERDWMEILEDREPVKIGSIQVLPFPTFHDAAEPMGFLIRSDLDDDKIVFATDTVNLGYQFPGVTVAAVECNYDEDILNRAERMPEKVRYRVQNAHMSISRACLWLEKLDKSRLKEVFLLHLSDACSSEWRFLKQAQAAVGPGVKVTICPKERMEGTI